MPAGSGSPGSRTNRGSSGGNLSTRNLGTRNPQVRGTQSLVDTLAYCWSRPSLLAIEVAWRWLFGAPALLVLYWQGTRLAAAASLASTGIYDLSLADPLKAAATGTDTVRVLLPPVAQVTMWLLPLLFLGWAIASGLGRNILLRRYDAALRFSPLRLIALQLLRVVALGLSFAGWFAAVRWAARVALGGGGTDANVEPNLVLYCALLICLSLGAFTLWALLSWVFSIAPLLVLAEGKGIVASVRESLRLGPLTAKLVEVNLVLGIVKLALIVLAMVFSATPLPFEGVVAGTPLYLWWAAVTLVYFAASDFFQVARLIAFLELRAKFSDG